MKTEHLSEIEIQQFALDKANCEKNIIDHIALCQKCMVKAANYQLMFSGIKQDPKPVFDFDLAVLVLKQIPKTQTSVSSNFFFFYFLVAVTMGSIGIAGYIFRAYLSRIFTGILPIVMYLIIITAAAILVFQAIELYKKYQKKMQSLNSY